MVDEKEEVVDDDDEEHSEGDDGDRDYVVGDHDIDGARDNEESDGGGVARDVKVNSDVYDGAEGAEGDDGDDGDGGLDPSEQLAQLLRDNDLVFQSIHEVVQAKPPLVNGLLDGSMVGRDVAIWNLLSTNPGWILVRITKYYAKLEQGKFNYEIRMGNQRMDKLLEISQYNYDDETVDAGSWVVLKKLLIRSKKKAQTRDKSLYAYVPKDASRLSLEEQILEESKQVLQANGKSLRSAFKKK